MFPNHWHQTNLTHISENGLTVMRTDLSSSRIIIRTNDSIPLKEILKQKFSKQNLNDSAISSSATPSSSSTSSIHSGITIDPLTGVPIHENNSSPSSTNSIAISNERQEELFTEIGLTVYDSWESDVLRIQGPIYYWEIQILSTVNSDFEISSVAIGLTPMTSQYHTYQTSINDLPNTVSYHSSGTRYHSNYPPERINGSGYGTHDIVGCGWEIGGDGRVFFTCNGKIVGNCMSGYGTQGQTYYPTLELYGIGTTVRANFGNSKFQLLVSDRLVIANLEMVEYIPNATSIPTELAIPTAHPAPKSSHAPLASVTTAVAPLSSLLPSQGMIWTNKIRPNLLTSTVTSATTPPPRPPISSPSSPHYGSNTMEYPLSTSSSSLKTSPNARPNSNRRNSDGTGFSGVYGYPPLRQRTVSGNNRPDNRQMSQARSQVSLSFCLTPWVVLTLLLSKQISLLDSQERKKNLLWLQLYLYKIRVLVLILISHQLHSHGLNMTPKKFKMHSLYFNNLS
jgi:hypothetical protein